MNRLDLARLRRIARTKSANSPYLLISSRVRSTSEEDVDSRV